MSALLALIPVLVAIAIGIGIGLLGGGNLGNLLQWRPAAWEVAAGAIAVQVLADAFSWSGVVPFILGLASVAALVYVAWMNRRVGGMVVVAIGLAMNLVPMLINGGTPVSAEALVSSGAVEQAQVASVQLTGPRHLADADDLLRPLGAVVPLPIGLVISFGDLVALLGVTLVTQAVLRRRQVRAGGPAPPARNPRVTLATYQEALETLGQGPADNRNGVEVEHVTLGSSGNVRPVPMRNADASAPLDVLGPRLEGFDDEHSVGDLNDAGVTVSPVSRSDRGEGVIRPDAYADDHRPRRRVVPPHGDIRPAPSGLDPDTGESSVVALTSLPPRTTPDESGRPTDSGGPADLPPGWSRAANQTRDQQRSHAAAPYVASPTPRVEPTNQPIGDDNAAAEPSDATAAVPVTGPAGQHSARSYDPAPDPSPQPAQPAQPAQAGPPAPPPPDPPRPEAGTRPGGVRRRGAPPHTFETPPPPPPDAQGVQPVEHANVGTPDQNEQVDFDEHADLDVSDFIIDDVGIDEGSLTAEHEAFSQTQSTPAVAPEEPTPGRWRVPASARGRRPRRDLDPPDGTPGADAETPGASD